MLRKRNMKKNGKKKNKERAPIIFSKSTQGQQTIYQHKFLTHNFLSQNDKPAGEMKNNPPLARRKDTGEVLKIMERGREEIDSRERSIRVDYVQVSFPSRIRGNEARI